MTKSRIIVHRKITIGALILSVATLPFSVKLCHAAIIVLILSWLCEGSWKEKWTIINQSLLLQITIALFLLQVAGLAFADNLTRGWLSVEKKVFFVLLPVALATSVIRLNRRELNLIFAAFLISCLAGTVICAALAWQETIELAASGVTPTSHTLGDPFPGLSDDQSPYWLLFSYVRLSNGIGMHPTYFALYLAVCILFLLDRLSSIRGRFRGALAVMIIFYLTIFVMLLSSRIVILGVCLMFLFLLCRSLARRQIFLGLMAIGVSAIFIAILVVNPVARYRNVADLHATTFDIEPGKHYTTAAQIRVSLWWLALHSLKKSNPLVGEGTGDVHKVMARTSVGFDITNVIHSFDPHNQYLYTWLANGIPAMSALILCLGLPAWWAWLRRDTMLVGLMFLFGLVCTTESALELQKGIVLYSLASGLLFFHKHSFQNISVNFRSLLRVGEERL